MARLEFPTFAPLPEELPEGTPQPFWSVMIPTYNRSKYLEAALRSVLEQVGPAGRPFEPAEMQIEVVDNASSNPEVEELVRRVGGDRVAFFRHPQNVGMAGNWNACVERARGRWVHILHDDDIVLPGFYARYREFIEANPQVGMVFSRPILMDEAGEWKSIMFTPASLQKTKVWEDGLLGLVSENTSNFLRCPTIVVKREAYEKAGGFDLKTSYTPDLQMWIRAAAVVEVGYVHQPLALYREHSENATNALLTKADLISDIARTLRLGVSLLPPEKREQAQRGADVMAASTAEMYRWHLHSVGLHRTALKYSRGLYRHAPGRRSALLLLKSLTRALQEQVTRSKRGARAST